MKPISFVRFASEVVRRPLTQGQSVFARVAFDHEHPSTFEDRDRDIAREIFGEMDEIPDGARRVVAGVFGRDSGKTTLAATLGVYKLLTASVSGLGPGEIAVAVVVAPDLKTARLTVRMAIGIVRARPALAGFVVSEAKEGFVLKRQDGALVAFEALAASRGGAALRGRPIITAILDECAFFYSGDGYVRTDGDIFRAITPRLMPGGIVLLISTPWGEESLIHKLYAENFGAPKTAIVARAPTVLMRDNDPTVVANVEAERLRDPDNCAREYFCEFLSSDSSKFFDPLTIDRAVDPELIVPMPPTSGATCGRGMDLGLTRDSAAHAVVERRGERFSVVSMTELRPRKGAPLKLSETIATFASDGAPYGATDILADGWCREPAREYTDAHRLTISPAPEGQQGKRDVYMLAKKLLGEGRLAIPNLPRLVAQFKSVTSKPTPGGGLQISTPRRAGAGHGDLLSAVLLGVWAAHQAQDVGVLGAVHTIPGGFDYAPLGFGHGQFGEQPELDNWMHSELKHWMERCR